MDTTVASMVRSPTTVLKSMDSAVASKDMKTTVGTDVISTEVDTELHSKTVHTTDATGDKDTDSPNQHGAVNKFRFKPAIIHPMFPEPELQVGLKYELLTPVSVFVSPSEFNVELKVSRTTSSKLGTCLQSFNSKPSPVSWKVEKSAPVAAMYNGSWFRGIPLKKKSGEYLVYLPDNGQSISVNQSCLRPLSEDAFRYPVCSVQVF